jgi:hypothetical protein
MIADGDVLKACKPLLLTLFCEAEVVAHGKG